MLFFPQAQKPETFPAAFATGDRDQSWSEDDCAHS